MRVRKLLDWRKLLIYTHRWLGIVLGAVFVAWCVSGIVLMYFGVPHLTAGERLMRLPVLDPSNIRVSPEEAAAQLKEPPRRLRISMHGDRPVYRFNNGRVFGRWTLIYADTGEPVNPLDRDRAMAWLKAYLPEQTTLRYDSYLQRPDTYTRLPAMQTHFPLHRVALDDAAGTEYYVSERSGEAVMKSNRRTRLLGLFGYITHTFFFFRQQSWWSALLQWVSWTGLAMCLTGAVVVSGAAACQHPSLARRHGRDRRRHWRWRTRRHGRRAQAGTRPARDTARRRFLGPRDTASRRLTNDRPLQSQPLGAAAPRAHGVHDGRALDRGREDFGLHHQRLFRAR